MKKFFGFILRHKFISLIVIASIVGGIYYYQNNQTEVLETSYEMEKVEKDSLMVTVTGLGQVSNVSDVDLKPKVSGSINFINIKEGDFVEAGSSIATIDNRDALRKVSEAQTNLEIARLDLEELLEESDDYTVLQAENDILDAKDDLIKLTLSQKQDLEKNLEDQVSTEKDLLIAYEDVYTTVSNTFLDLPDLKTALYNILYSYEIRDNEGSINSPSQNIYLLQQTIDSRDRHHIEVFMDIAETDYLAMEALYNESIIFYQTLDRDSTNTEILKLLDETLVLVEKTEKSIKSTVNLLDYWVDYRERKEWDVYTTVTDYQSSLDTYLSTNNRNLSNLLTVDKTIDTKELLLLSLARNVVEMEQNNPLELAAAARAIEEKEAKLLDLDYGVSEIQIKSKELTITQRLNNLLEAQQDLDDHYVIVPFTGLVTAVNVSLGETVASSSLISSLISEKQTAVITLNEVDVAKVKEGQKVVLEFDAIDDLIITGEVNFVDIVGKVDQGVVSFDVEISFDLQDERIKTGMTVSSTIIIKSKNNVLVLANSVIDEKNNINTVDVLENDKVVKKTITVGIANDVYSEILEGLDEGDEVISKIINPSESSSTTSSSSPSDQNSILRMMR